MSVLLLLLACGGDKTPDEGQDTAPAGDSAAADADDSDGAGDGSGDEGDDTDSDAPAGDSGGDTAGDTAAVPDTCGDGVLDPDELCDSDVALCGDLGEIWVKEGEASCRADCSGYDVDTCELGTGDLFEFFKAAERDERWADARCADGSSAVYAVRPSPSRNDTWLIYLTGGGACDDYSLPCAEMYADVTSDDRLDGALGPVGADGIFDMDPKVNPDFWDANLVYVRTCTADRWSGTSPAPTPNSASEEGYYFVGRRSLDATLESLQQRFGLDDADEATRVLFAGGSGGALGAMNAIFQVADTLPLTVAGGRMKAMVDAGWNTPWDDPDWPLLQADVPDVEVFRYRYDYWQSSLDPECVAAQPAGEGGNCFLSQTLYPYLEVPVLVQQNARDPNWLGEHGMDAENTEHEEAIMAWELATRASMAEIQWLYSGSEAYPNGVRYHTLATTNSLFLDFCPNAPDACDPGSTFAEVLHDFWNDSAPPRRVVW